MYDVHSFYGQFSGCHFSIDFSKAFNDVSCLPLLGALFETFGKQSTFCLAKKTLLLFVNYIVKTFVN